MEPIRSMIAQLGTRRLALIGGSGLAAIIAMGLLLAGGDGDMAYLYSDLDPESAQMVTERLRGQGIAFELSPDGTAVMAPADKVAELRMSLAGEQIGGKIGYEILDKEEPFGTSASRARLNETRAIEGELARSIESLQRVRQARVHLVMPERQLFEQEARPASAAITLKTSGRLSAQETDAIRYLVAAAVPALSPDRISIVDQNGTLLARVGDGEAGAGALDERRLALERRLREDIETMLERVVGPGRVRAQVAAELNAEEVREEAQIFDPDGQVVAKTTTVETSDEADERSGGPEVGVAGQLPENQQPAGAGGDTRRSAQNERSEEVSYDNSRVVKTSVRPGGSVQRLTVSVMVDGSYVTEPDGRTVYTPRQQAELERLTRLVENAIGYNQERGDRVVVENLRFVPDETAATDEGSGLTAADYLNYGTKLILGLLGLAALWIIVRALRRNPPEPVEGALVEPALLEGPEVMSPEMRALLSRAAAGDEEAVQALQAMQGQTAGPLALEQEIELAALNGRIKTSMLERVSDLVAQNTGEAAAVLRRWMHA